jgi:hypothetical protein
MLPKAPICLRARSKGHRLTHSVASNGTPIPSPVPSPAVAALSFLEIGEDIGGLVVVKVASTAASLGLLAKILNSQCRCKQAE